MQNHAYELSLASSCFSAAFPALLAEAAVGKKFCDCPIGLDLPEAARRRRGRYDDLDPRRDLGRAVWRQSVSRGMASTLSLGVCSPRARCAFSAASSSPTQRSCPLGEPLNASSEKHELSNSASI
jgi:hypothetical protein